MRQRNPEIHRLGPMDLKIHTLAKKTATVTRQLTKSTDFYKNHLCDFHAWVEQGDSAGVVSALEWMGESGRAPFGRKSRNLGRRAPPATAAGAPEIKGTVSRDGFGF